MIGKVQNNLSGAGYFNQNFGMKTRITSSGVLCLSNQNIGYDAFKKSNKRHAIEPAFCANYPKEPNKTKKAENIIIAPSILAADPANLKRDIKEVEKAGAQWLHVDIMDGHFVPNITAFSVADLRKITDMTLDVHLMVENPQKLIPDYIKAGADSITFHIEAAGDKTAETIDMIKKAGKKVGISIKPNTPTEVLEEYIKDVDLVLIMTVEPGFGGQSFKHDCLQKINKVKEMSDSVIIQVDGGINKDTARICKEYGATSLVAGSFIYGSKNIEEAVNSLKF